MGFKYTDRVYKGVRNTKGTEQAVLALLAHFADDKTGECFPAQETLAERTRFSRATVVRALNALKAKGYLVWITGGRRKNGRVCSNLYKLVLPKATPKRVDKFEFLSWNDEIPGVDRVSQCDTPVSHSDTSQCLTLIHNPVSQRDTPLSQSETLSSIGSSTPSSISHPSGHNQPPAAGETPGRFELGVARRNGTLDDVLKKVNAAGREMKRAEHQSVVDFAMEASCTNAVADKKVFSSVMLRKHQDDCRELIYQFDAERRADEFKNIRNLPALLVKRLKQLPDIV